MSDRSPNGEVAGLVEELRAEADQISAALPVFANLYRRAAGHIEIQTARLAGARKLADGYGIVLAMIAAGCSDPQRFAARMLAEYDHEAKALGIVK